MRLATHQLPGLVLTGHQLEVPLDHAHPDGPRIRVFAREVVATAKEKDDLPWLVFLQGGPGFSSPRPEGKSGWLERALDRYRVLLIDQRGTGRSTPIGHQTLAALGTPARQAEYFAHFRADSIVRDAELLRRELIGAGGKWTVLGQSFGGFCTVTYLSVAPEGLAGALITGGLPPLAAGADNVYRATYRRTIERNQRYYARYPEDVAHVQEIAAAIARGAARLPDGDVLTVRRFQQLGMSLGMSYGAARLHYLLEEGFVDGAAGRELSYNLLHGIDVAQPFQTNPIYAALHEACYAQGVATRWSAERVRAEFPEMTPAAGAPVPFTGEMIYPWMFEDYRHLRPLRAAAEILAARSDWTPLYDRARLAANTVPCAAVIYADDMYVDRAFSEETAAAIRGLKAWVTNEHQHDGLRSAGKEIFDKLLKMLSGDIDVPA